MCQNYLSLRYQITTGNTFFEPLWSPDGQELFYLNVALQMRSVTIDTQSGFAYGVQQFLPSVTGTLLGPQAVTNFDVMPDGQRFLVVRQLATDSGEVDPTQINIIQNWFGELKELVPVP